MLNSLREHLREADASLLALLRESDPTSEELTALQPDSPPKLVTPKSEKRLLEAAASADSVQLRDALSLYVSNAQLPLGAQLCTFIDKFRDEHAIKDATAAPSDAPPRLLEIRLPQIPLLWRFRRAREPPASAALAAAVSSVRSALAELRVTLATQLPMSLREHPSALHEGRMQLEGSLFRAIHPTIARIYERAHSAEISVLAQRCHELKLLLPCDLAQLPRDVWLLPDGDGAAAASARMVKLRDAAVSNALLPYASAIQVHRQPARGSRGPVLCPRECTALLLTPRPYIAHAACLRACVCVFARARVCVCVCVCVCAAAAHHHLLPPARREGQGDARGL